VNLSSSRAGDHPEPASPSGRLLHGPFFWTSALFVLVVLVVRPWGNFPLNDDWQYARVTKALAETGHFQLDVKIAPSLVAQAYLAAPFVRLFGFSHTLLRLLTMGLALVLLRAIDRILAVGGANRPVRLLAGVLLIINPIFLHAALSFMTEIWGVRPGAVGCLDMVRRPDQA